MALKPVSRETSNFFQRSRLFKEVGRELYGQPVPIQPPISKTLFPEEHSPFQQEVDLRGGTTWGNSFGGTTRGDFTP
jgi:hypothetical protein